MSKKKKKDKKKKAEKKKEEKKNKKSAENIEKSEQKDEHTESMTLEEAGAVLRMMREGQGMSQRQAGESAGLSSSVVGAIERGKPVSLSSLRKIAAAYGYDIHVILERDGN